MEKLAVEARLLTVVEARPVVGVEATLLMAR